MPARPDADLRIATLDARHDRAGFACGVESLDRYLKTQASQDLHRKANGVFVLTESAALETILGYYTLCATALSHGEVPEVAKRYLPRYPLVSATLIGRLAIAKEWQSPRAGCNTAYRRPAARLRERLDRRLFNDRRRCVGRTRSRILRGSRLHTAAGLAPARASDTFDCRIDGVINSRPSSRLYERVRRFAASPGACGCRVFANVKLR